MPTSITSCGCTVIAISPFQGEAAAESVWNVCRQHNGGTYLHTSDRSIINSHSHHADRNVNYHDVQTRRFARVPERPWIIAGKNNKYRFYVIRRVAIVSARILAAATCRHSIYPPFTAEIGFPDARSQRVLQIERTMVIISLRKRIPTVWWR